MTTQAWWKEAVAYQIYPKSFMDANNDGIGDLRGIITKLDYLKDLGIDIIWICPMYKSPFDDNGYDISDYQEIANIFGNMADFDELLAETHKRGMKLIIDLVINHTSDEHPWFIESRSSAENPKRDWYIWRDGKAEKEPNNWESIFGGSAWEYDENTKQYYYHCFAKSQPDLNWENDDVRQALYDMINWWLDKGIDGFRVDAISHIKKMPGFPDLPNPTNLPYVPSFDGHMNQPGIHEWLEELNEKTFSHYDIMTVGEANGVSAEEAVEWVGDENGKFNMVFQFEFLDLWGADSKKGHIDVLGTKKVLTRWQKALENNGWNALFIENHDKARVVSTWGNDEEYWAESAKSFAMMYFMMQGTPYIYQGQEIGMTNIQMPSIDDYDDVKDKNFYRIEREKGTAHEDIMSVIWQNSRDNSRTPMQWNNKQNGGFTTATPWLSVNPNYTTINVEAQQQDEQSILHFYKQLIRLRKQHNLFVYGQYDLILENHPNIYAYTRTLDGQKAVIITNLTSEATTYHYEEVALSSDKLALSNYDVASHESTTTIELKPYEARLYIL
ncbi:MAG: alpha-glucosidase [Bacillaceae bacterium]